MQDLVREKRIIFGHDETKLVELKVYARDYEAKLPSVIEMDTRLGANELRELFPESKRHFQFPKPSQFIRELLQFATDKDSLVMDSFAGSGTTAHAVLALNQADGGNRRFVLIEGEDYADSITAERVRRVIKGVPTARVETLRSGLGGTFSYFQLGKPLSLHSILEGRDLPDYASLARYLFFTATGEEFDPRRMKRKEHFIGPGRLYDVFLLYTEDPEKLKSLALTLDVARALRGSGAKQKLVFAPTKYLDEHFLDRLRVTFQQLPFQIYQALDN
jgi:adenine-specific DNA-methyltransferase